LILAPKGARAAAAATGLGALLLALALAGCASKPVPLYYWENYPSNQYATLKRDGASVQERLAQMQADSTRAAGAGLALPPGFRAHLGLLYLADGNPGEAQKLWHAEKTAFPESAPFMDRLLKRLEAPAGQGAVAAPGAAPVPLKPTPGVPAAPALSPAPAGAPTSAAKPAGN
jgi:hypothetical protein